MSDSKADVGGMGAVQEVAWKIEVVPDREFASTVCDEIVFSANEVVEEKQSCSIGLAGGSTPGVVYRTLSRPPYKEQIAWNRIKLFLGDERFVPAENDQSNFRMIRETMLAPLGNVGVQAYPVDTSLASAAESAKDYAELFVSHGFSLEHGLDLILLGLGEDGHTASLFPGSPLLSDSSSLVGAAVNPGDGSARISISGPFLQAASRILVLVRGASKAEIVRSVMRREPKALELPIEVLFPIKDRVTWFLDSSAAQKL